MQTIHNPLTDDTVVVPDFVIKHFLDAGKIFKCDNCDLYHIDHEKCAPKKVMREAYKMALN